MRVQIWTFNNPMGWLVTSSIVGKKPASINMMSESSDNLLVYLEEFKKQYKLPRNLMGAPVEPLPAEIQNRLRMFVPQVGNTPLTTDLILYFQVRGEGKGRTAYCVLDYITEKKGGECEEEKVEQSFEMNLPYRFSHLNVPAAEMFVESILSMHLPNFTHRHPGFEQEVQMNGNGGTARIILPGTIMPLSVDKYFYAM